MQVEIDQSGKIEETNRDTVLAFSNGKNDTVIILAETKRRILEIFRRRGEPKLYIYRTFTAGVFLLVHPYLAHIDSIMCDIEWEGKNRVIADIFNEFLQKYAIEHKPTLHFQLVGKQSPAHILAWTTYKTRPYPRRFRKVSFKQLLSLVIRPIKKDRGR